jgi:MinD superfamily P-loop ATPase
MIKIAVASGKGGTGKTFVATNVFHSLMKNKLDAVLVDCDAEAPNAAAFFRKKLIGTIAVTQPVPVIDESKCVYCAKCHEFCNYNAIFILPPVKIIKVIGDLCHGCGACNVACTYEAITEKQVPLGVVNVFSENGRISIIEARMNIGVMSAVPVIKAAIRNINPDTEIAILDSPPGTSCPFIQTVATADFVILVTEPTPFGLSDLRQSVETLRNIDKPCGVIINRAGLGNNGVREYIDSEGIPLLMEIPFSRRTAKFYSEGKILADEDRSFGQNLFSMIQYIKRNYGNSSNQR